MVLELVSALWSRTLVLGLVSDPGSGLWSLELALAQDGPCRPPRAPVGPRFGHALLSFTDSLFSIRFFCPAVKDFTPTTSTPPPFTPTALYPPTASLHLQEEEVELRRWS